MQSPSPILAVALAATLGSTASAAGTQPLQVASKIFVEARSAAADGTVRTTLVAANRAVPGDRVVFVLAYRNAGTQALDNIVFNNPLPAAIAYRAPAQGSAAPEVSVGGKTYGALAALRVPVAGGGSRAATASDVTHVRWRLSGSLAAGGQGQFAFQAVLK